MEKLVGRLGNLVLSRRPGESIVIGDPEKPLGVIDIVDITGDTVRIALQFPREVNIAREELPNPKP